MTELLATMPQVDLIDNCVVRFEAIDATTGTAVAGVKVSNATVYVYAEDATPENPADYSPLPYVTAGQRA